MSKYGVFSGSYFTAFRLNTGKYGPEKTPHLNTFHAVTTKPIGNDMKIKRGELTNILLRVKSIYAWLTPKAQKWVSKF